MKSFELVNPNTGKPCGVFACGVCNKLRGKEFVDRCCEPCPCGEPTWSEFQKECQKCYDKRMWLKGIKRMDDATIIEWDGSMMLFSEVLPNDWATSIEDVEECFNDKSEYDPGFERPEFVFASKKRRAELDLDQAVEAMLEDTFDDAELHSMKAYEVLLEHVAAFNVINGVDYFEPDFKHKIRIRQAWTPSVDRQVRTPGVDALTDYTMELEYRVWSLCQFEIPNLSFEGDGAEEFVSGLMSKYETAMEAADEPFLPPPVWSDDQRQKLGELITTTTNGAWSPPPPPTP